jgi:hypothetical protein
VDPIRLATCLDRSIATSGAIVRTLLLATAGGKRLRPDACRWSSLLWPAERLALVELSRRRAAAGAGLDERSKPVSEALRTVAKACAGGRVERQGRAGRQSGRAGQRAFGTHERDIPNMGGFRPFADRGGNDENAQTAVIPRWLGEWLKSTRSRPRRSSP